MRLLAILLSRHSRLHLRRDVGGSHAREERPTRRATPLRPKKPRRSSSSPGRTSRTRRARVRCRVCRPHGLAEAKRHLRLCSQSTGRRNPAAACGGEGRCVLLRRRREAPEVLKDDRISEDSETHGRRRWGWCNSTRPRITRRTSPTAPAGGPAERGRRAPATAPTGSRSSRRSPITRFVAA